MRKTLLIIFMFSTFAASAQENIIKLNFSSLLLGNIGLQYEANLNLHSSLCIGISYLPSSHLPKFIRDEDSTKNLESLTFSGWSFTPEYRYYVSGKAPTGFYLAPYFRYSTYTIDEIILTYSSTATGLEIAVPAYGTFKGTTVGLMVGAQWSLSEHLSLDWWILGAGFGSQKAELTALGNFSPTDVQDIKNELADIDVTGDLQYNVNSNSVNISYDPETPGIRGFGICLGYKF